LSFGIKKPPLREDGGTRGAASPPPAPVRRYARPPFPHEKAAPAGSGWTSGLACQTLTTSLRWHYPDQVQRDQGACALSQPLRAPPVVFLLSRRYSVYLQSNSGAWICQPDSPFACCGAV